MKQAAAAQLMNVLIAAYAVPAWSDETAELFKEYLLDLPDEETRKAINRIIVLDAERPTVARIREMTARVLAENEGVTYPDPQRAWRYVQRRIAWDARLEPITPDHTIICEVVKTMGWRNLCVSTRPEKDRSDFIWLYKEAIKNDLNKRVLAASEGAITNLLRSGAEEVPTCSNTTGLTRTT